MHVLLQVEGDSYEILDFSEREADLLGSQRTNPLRIVVDADSVNLSFMTQRDKRAFNEKLLAVATEKETVH